jgi:MFS family permease
MGVGRFAFTPILPMMQAEQALTLAAGGWLAAANYAGYLAGALTAMRLDGRLAIRAGLLGIAFGTLAMGLGQPFAGWLALRLLAGVASAWVLIHVSAWSLERLAAVGAPALGGTVYAGVGAGIALAGAACLVLMRMQASAASAWLVLGALSLTAVALLWTQFDIPAVTRQAATPAPPWDLHSGLLVLCYAAFGFGYIIPATFLPAMARAALGDPALFGWAWPIFGTAAAASTLAAAPLAQALGNRAVWAAGHLIMALGVAAPLLVPGMAGILVAAACVGGTFMVITMVGLQEARRAGGAGLMAAMTAGFAAGQIAGPVVVGLVPSVFQASLAACAALVAGALALMLRKR